jgi:hypothetical protein
MYFIKCIADDCDGAGIKIDKADTNYFLPLIINNQITNCGIGLHFTDAQTKDSLGVFESLQALVRNNNIYNSTTAQVRFGASGSDNDIFGTDHYQPYNESSAATRLSNEDWSVNSTAKEKGFDDEVIGGTTTRSYVDQGPQRQEPAGGGTTVVIPRRRRIM